jgi:hypothetical protein
LVAGLTGPQRLELAHYLLSAEDLTDLARTNRMLSRPEEDTRAVEVVEAVCSLVPTWRARPAAGWAAHHKLGATMLAARLERRKDSPGGMVDFAEGGAGYVQGNWPDVAMLLGLGTYAVGRVG